MLTVRIPIMILESVNSWPFNGFIRPSAIIDFVEIYSILIRPDSTNSVDQVGFDLNMFCMFVEFRVFRK